MHHRIFSTLVLSSILLAPLLVIANAPLEDELSQAIRLTPDITRGQTLFNNNCSHCHGEDAWGTTDGRFPQIAGQHSSVIIKQLADIRSGNRDIPEMLPFASETTIGGPQAIADIAAYLSTLPMEPDPEYGESDDQELLTAKNLYQDKCATCHGINGEGNGEKFYPLIHGQHYEYLLRELIWIRDGKRKNSYPPMVEAVKSMSNKQFEMLSDYLSQLMPPEEKLGQD